ncbi:MAG: hypothetical protein KTR32_31520 [Granulosicoccus sp.]|nr:hypothetical protein [Granulosicoccus sp.]
MAQITDKAEAALARAESLGDELDRIFIQLDRDRILAEAARLDANQQELAGLPLYGLIISLKDLFDEAGEVTTAGSSILRDRAPATQDATVVSRLKAAGALLFGRTSLSEFAYSGIGANPHHGTPGCFYDRSLIPGGSSSGAALTVAHSLCDLAMGTDTGGSVRVPAAINGLYGFKPSAQTVPTTGVHPLSVNYDSVGPLAPSFELLVQCMKVIRSEPLESVSQDQPMKFAVASDAFTDDLDPSVASAFKKQLDQLINAGHSIEELSFDALNGWTSALRLTVSYEAQTYYKDYLQRLESEGDPNVLGRIHQSDGMTAADLEACQQQRREAIAFFEKQLRGYDALLAPTMKCEPPSIQAAQNDFLPNNSAVLRNTTYINLVDGCALTLPVQRDAMQPAALMVCGPNGMDSEIISVGERIDQIING